jgi:hypothetical protein
LSKGTNCVSPDAILGCEVFRACDESGQAGRDDGLAFGFEGGEFKVEAEEEGEGVFLFLHAVGGADGRVEGGRRVES